MINEAGDGAGTLRKLLFTIHVSRQYYYYGLEGLRGYCYGDSGGPHLGKMLNGLWVIAGITSASDGSGLCTSSGGRLFAAAIYSRIDWIRSVIGTNVCTKFGYYTQCFP